MDKTTKLLTLEENGWDISFITFNPKLLDKCYFKFNSLSASII